MVVMPLDIPDLISSNLGLAETGAKGKAGGVQRLPLLLLGLGIVLCVRIAVPFPPCFQGFFCTVRWYERVLMEC